MSGCIVIKRRRYIGKTNDLKQSVFQSERVITFSLPPFLMSYQSYYFDSSVIIAYFDERDKDRNEMAKKIISKVRSAVRKNPEIKVKIPSVVLAEIFMKLIEDERVRNRLDEFFALVRDLKADFPAPKIEHYEEALHLLQKDPQLEPHDSMIVAHALLDEETKYLFTFDSKLINNKVIKKRKSEKGVSFKISDEF